MIDTWACCWADECLHHSLKDSAMCEWALQADRHVKLNGTAFLGRSHLAAFFTIPKVLVGLVAIYEPDIK